MDTAFRKIDIDIYDEDVLQDSELYEADPRGPAEVLDDAKQRQAAVRSFLARYFFLMPHSILSSHLESFRTDWKWSSLIPFVEMISQELWRLSWKMHLMVLMSTKPRYAHALWIPWRAITEYQSLLCMSIQKLITLQTLLTILNTTKSTEISGVIKTLSLDTQDTLMKYLYKGMAMPGWGDISGSVLLGWHEKVRVGIAHITGRKTDCECSQFQLTEVAGVGCIVRTMTDRRIV